MTFKTRRLLALFSATIATVAVLAAIAVAVGLSYDGQVLPQTRVAGVSYGGLTYQDARQQLTADTKALERQLVSVRLDTQTEQLTLRQLGVTLQPSQTFDQLLTDTDPWDALTIGFWKTLFKGKEYAIAYELDETQLAEGLREVFGVTESAQNATIQVEKGALVVVPGQSARTLDIPTAQESLKGYIAGTHTGAISLSFAQVEPDVSTLAAQKTKKELESLLVPLFLVGADKKFTVPVADQYGLLAFDSQGKTLAWRIDEAKLKTYVDTKIGAKLTVKVKPKLIQSTDGAIIQEGADGQEVDTPKLVVQIQDAITKRLDTAAQPIEIVTRTVAFKEQVVDPEYVGGLYEGLYVYVNIDRQKLFVMEGNTKISEHLISSGKSGNPTPRKVTLYIKNKIELARSRLFPDLWMRKWNALAANPDGSGYDGYGIHGLPCFDPNCNRVEGESHLGRPVSHGCIRLDHAAAQYFYDKIPIGTPVVIN